MARCNFNSAEEPSRLDSDGAQEEDELFWQHYWQNYIVQHTYNCVIKDQYGYHENIAEKDPLKKKLAASRPLMHQQLLGHHVATQRSFVTPKESNGGFEHHFGSGRDEQWRNQAYGANQTYVPFHLRNGSTPNLSQPQSSHLSHGVQQPSQTIPFHHATPQYPRHIDVTCHGQHVPSPTSQYYKNKESLGHGNTAPEGQHMFGYKDEHRQQSHSYYAATQYNDSYQHPSQHTPVHTESGHMSIGPQSHHVPIPKRGETDDRFWRVIKKELKQLQESEAEMKAEMKIEIRRANERIENAAEKAGRKLKVTFGKILKGQENMRVYNYQPNDRKQASSYLNGNLPQKTNACFQEFAGERTILDDSSPPIENNLLFVEEKMNQPSYDLPQKILCEHEEIASGQTSNTRDSFRYPKRSLKNQKKPYAKKEKQKREDVKQRQDGFEFMCDRPEFQEKYTFAEKVMKSKSSHQNEPKLASCTEFILPLNQQRFLWDRGKEKRLLHRSKRHRHHKVLDPPRSNRDRKIVLHPSLLHRSLSRQTSNRNYKKLRLKSRKEKRDKKTKSTEFLMGRRNYKRWRWKIGWETRTQ